MSPDGPTDQVDAVAAATLVETRVSLLIYHRQGSLVVDLSDEQSIIIGRTEPADVIVSDRSLSRRHARVERHGTSVWIEDLQSTNGTWLNNKRLTARARFQPPDDLRLGAITVTLHLLNPGEERLAELEDHDVFVDRLAEEIIRARTFGYTTAILLVRAEKPSRGHLSRWYPAIHEFLRPVDHAALYGPHAMLLFFPRYDRAMATTLAEKIVVLRSRGIPRLLCGIALCPENGTSSDELIEAARLSARSATSRRPIRFASRNEKPTSTTSTPPTKNPAVLKLLQTAARVAKTDTPILITGETGSGKEVLAREIHGLSSRRKTAIRSVNCGAIPEQLLESILFGHEKGSFTNANQRQLGVFEQADGGTVLLDEIGELSPGAQTALLRVIETKKITRVGGEKEIALDIRIIAATHRNLEAMCQRGDFRWDLFYRLNVVTLHLPSLRDRREDILPLARHFIKLASDGRGHSIDPAAEEMLVSYEWPGNIRELRNVIDRAVALCDTKQISVDDLSERLQRAHEKRRRSLDMTLPNSQQGAGIKEKLRRYEAQIILDALQDHGWNQTKTAKALGISRRSLVDKIRTYQIKKSYKAELP